MRKTSYAVIFPNYFFSVRSTSDRVQTTIWFSDRPLDVAEEDDGLVVGHILRGVNVGLVNSHGLAFAPEVLFAVDANAAVRRVD